MRTWWALLWLMIAPASFAGDGTEIVLVLDNSCSMPAEGTINGEPVPPNDPDRAAVLGALLVEGLVRGSQDQLTVIGFGKGKEGEPKVVDSAQGIRSMKYTGGTWFRMATREARSRLDASTREHKLLMLFTDGAPSEDDFRKQELAETLRVSEGDADFFVIGLYGSDATRRMGEQFLSPLAQGDAELAFLEAGKPETVQQVVREFTRGYARVLGSKPELGTLKLGDSRQIGVGRYVTEVMVTAASVLPGKAFAADLIGPGGSVNPHAAGDNGCPQGVILGNAPTICDEPRRHYQVFRAANDPEKESTWTLSLPTAPAGDVEYGVILRYDLQATLAVPSPIRVGTEVELDARLLFRGQTFDDESFFAKDDFEAEVRIGADVVKLTHEGGGQFTAKWTPSQPTGTPEGGGSTMGVVRFRNAWMEKKGRQEVAVEGFLPLTLRPSPNPIALGAWTGGRGSREECQVVDLSGSENADRVPVICQPSTTSPDVEVNCGPVPGSESKHGRPLQWQVCAVSAGCCGDAGGGGSVLFRGEHEHYAGDGVDVPVRFDVSRTGILRCWWFEIATFVGILFSIWFICGWMRPHKFEDEAFVKVGGSERMLRRSSGYTLSEQPGGKRGFYRNAKVCLDGEGQPVRKPAQAVIVLSAAPSSGTRFSKAGGLEKKNRRSGRYEPVPPEDLKEGFQEGAVYKIGRLYLQFG